MFLEEKTIIISSKIYLCFEVERKQLKYQKNRLLRTVLAILLLFTVSFGHTYANTVRQAFQSETFYSRNNNSERKIISYKRAIQLGVLDVKLGRSNAVINFSVAHTAKAKVRIIQKHKEYYSFKSNLQFFNTKTIPARVENIPVL